MSNVPSWLAEVSALPTIEVNKMAGGGYKATCPALPAVEPVVDDSQVLANALMQSRVRDHLIEGNVRDSGATRGKR